MFYFRSDQKSSAFKLIRFAKVNYIVSWRWKYQNHFALVLSGQRLYVKWRFPWAMRWQSPPTDFNPSLAELDRAGQSLNTKYQNTKYQIPNTKYQIPANTRGIKVGVHYYIFLTFSEVANNGASAILVQLCISHTKVSCLTRNCNYCSFCTCRWQTASWPPVTTISRHTPHKPRLYHSKPTTICLHAHYQC